MAFSHEILKQNTANMFIIQEWDDKQWWHHLKLRAGPIQLISFCCFKSAHTYLIIWDWTTNIVENVVSNSVSVVLPKSNPHYNCHCMTCHKHVMMSILAIRRQSLLQTMKAVMVQCNNTTQLFSNDVAHPRPTPFLFWKSWWSSSSNWAGLLH